MTIELNPFPPARVAFIFVLSKRTVFPVTFEGYTVRSGAFVSLASVSNAHHVCFITEVLVRAIVAIRAGTGGNKSAACAFTLILVCETLVSGAFCAVSFAVVSLVCINTDRFLGTFVQVIAGTLVY